MRIVLFDEQHIWNNFKPITFNKPLSEVRIGILTIAEKWKLHLECDVKYICEDSIQKYFKKNITEEDNLFINSAILPDAELIKELLQLQEGQSLTKDGLLIAYRRKFGTLIQNYEASEYNSQLDCIRHIGDILEHQKDEIVKDYHLITHGRHSQRIPDAYTTLYGKDIFIEEGASIKSAILNAEEGPVYIGTNCKVEEGAIIKGPFGMLDNSTVSMGAKIRNGVSIGPKCVIGGEVKNSIFHSFSNKAHDGYIGDSIIGSWCNFGAGTNCSNLKNNWNEVRIWNEETGQTDNTGRNKIGIIMGDYSMCGIGTQFNTGTVISLGCNVFNHQFPQKHIPAFSWGDGDVYRLEELMNTIKHIKNSKQEILGENEKTLISELFNKLVD